MVTETDEASRRPEAINPRTGLSEGWDDFYKVPLVHQKALGALRYTGQVSAVHTLPLGDGLSLDWYARLGKSDELVVTFHGANKREKNIYPMFARVASLRNKAPAMMAFADPTMMLDKSRNMLLSWYLGGSSIDPIPLIIRAARRAQSKTGSKHIAFVGGSGGGFAALRASAMIPGSMAFVQDPQTVIAHYIPWVADEYFRNAWPGWNQDALMEAFPERFDMASHYRRSRPENFVYYAQNAGDTSHVESHYLPFVEVHGVKGAGGRSADGTRVFSLYQGQESGHGKITSSEFDHHYVEAMRLWREYRAAG